MNGTSSGNPNAKEVNPFGDEDDEEISSSSGGGSGGGGGGVVRKQSYHLRSL